ncbi:MAG: flagellar assembly protein FliW [Sporichthyaceae bacterium]
MSEVINMVIARPEVPAPRVAPEGELPLLEFVTPLAGFSAHRRFVLAELEPAGGPLHALRSVEDPALRFLVVPPGLFFPDYVPEISDADAQQLGLTDASDALLLVIVTSGATVAEATANLLAPVVVNVANRRAAQVMVADAAMPLQALLRPPG